MMPNLSIIKGEPKLYNSKLIHKIFEDFVQTKCDDTKIAVIEECAEEAASNSEICTKKTYESLNSDANRIGNAIYNLLSKHPIEENADLIVAVCMKPSIELITTLLAIWKIGGAYLPLDAAFPMTYIEHALAESKPLLIVHDEDYENTSIFSKNKFASYQQLKKSSLFLSHQNIRKDKSLQKQELNDQLAIVMYTSGRSDEASGVRLYHSNLLNRLFWQFDRFPYSPSEKHAIFKTTLPFIDSVPEIWGPLLNGVILVIVPKVFTQNPEKLMEVLEKYRIERLVLVPTLLRIIVLNLLTNKSDKKRLSHLKLMISSGEHLPITLAREFFDYFTDNKHKLCNFYGSTETTGDVSYYIIEDKKQLDNFDKVPIGNGIYNTVIYILDNDYRPVKNGFIGQVHVAGRNICKGYIANKLSNRFTENIYAPEEDYSLLFKTGDYACYRNGVIYFEGRIDSQIKVRGYRVDMAAIEKQLLAINEIEKACVYCYKAGEWEQAIIGFATLRDTHRKMASIEIENIIATKLPAYSIPRIIVLHTIPVLINGKTDKQSLLKIYENIESLDNKVENNFTGVSEQYLTAAKTLFDTIKTVIGKSCRFKEISLQSNFYDLGGTSLNTMLTVRELKKKGYDISITSFLAADDLGVVLNEICNGSRKSVLLDFRETLRTHRLQHEHMEDIIHFIASSFMKKSELVKLLDPKLVERKHYAQLVEYMWEEILFQDLSFVVCDDSGKLLAVSINLDFNKHIRVGIENNVLMCIVGFMRRIEKEIRSELPKKKSIFYSYLMATNPILSPQQNVAIILYLEQAVIDKAKENHYAYIITNNQLLLTQSVAEDLGYRVLKEYLVNEYVHYDGKKPFAEAPNAMRALVSLKEL